MILWHLENMLTLAVMCMRVCTMGTHVSPGRVCVCVCVYCNECCIAIIWYYSHLWICSRSDTVYGPVSVTVKICLEKVLKKSLNW